MSSDVTIKSCPFCEGENAAYSAEAEAVICMVCSCEGPWAKTPTEAIAAWNQRADAQGERAAVVAWLDDTLFGDEDLDYASMVFARRIKEREHLA